MCALLGVSGYLGTLYMECRRVYIKGLDKYRRYIAIWNTFPLPCPQASSRNPNSNPSLHRLPHPHNHPCYLSPRIMTRSATNRAPEP